MPDPRNGPEPRARVLLAEDNPLNRSVSVAMLHKLGCEVETVDDGSAVLAALDRQAFDLVLMDCQMPVMDGLEATRLLRASGRTLPVIAISGQGPGLDHEACLNAGMNDSLPKPFGLEALDAMLRRWLPRSA